MPTPTWAPATEFLVAANVGRFGAVSRHGFPLAVIVTIGSDEVSASARVAAAVGIVRARAANGALCVIVCPCQ